MVRKAVYPEVKCENCGHVAVLRFGRVEDPCGECGGKKGFTGKVKPEEV